MSKTKGSDRRGFLKTIGAIGAAIIGTKVVGESVEKPADALREAMDRGDTVLETSAEPYTLMNTGSHANVYLEVSHDDA